MLFVSRSLVDGLVAMVTLQVTRMVILSQSFDRRYIGGDWSFTVVYKNK